MRIKLKTGETVTIAGGKIVEESLDDLLTTIEDTDDAVIIRDAVNQLHIFPVRFLAGIMDVPDHEDSYLNPEELVGLK